MLILPTTTTPNSPSAAIMAQTEKSEAFNIDKLKGLFD
jgi:hypothetical protein